MSAPQAVTVKDGTVWNRLREHYPPHVISWVRGLTWTREHVPFDQIHMQARPGAPRDEAKVKAIRKAIRKGKPMKPVTLVHTGRGRPHKIADGYHRLEAAKLEGARGHDALVGRTSKRSGPWSRKMHDAKLNT